MTEFKCPSCGALLTVSLGRAPKASSLEDVKALFPADLENLLSFEARQDYFHIKPRQFLGSDVFRKVASIIKAAGGQYVSAGKDSHFRIPK